MGVSVRPEVDPLEQLKALRATDPLEQLKAQKAATLRYDNTPANAGVIPSALDAMTFGLAPKITAATEAVGNELLGQMKPGDTFGTAYRQNLSAKRAAGEQYHEAHPYVDDAAQLAGGVAGVVATGGTNAPEDAATLGRLARFGKTIATGAKYGAASGAGHSDALEQGRGVSGLATDVGKGAAMGGAIGAASIPASALAGKVLGATPLPRLASQAAGKIANALPEGSAMQQIARAFSGATGAQGEANAVIAQRMAMDKQAGWEVPVNTLPPIRPLPPRVPVSGAPLASHELPTLAEVDAAVGDFRRQLANATDPNDVGELTSRLNQAEAMGRHLRGEAQPEMATAGASRAAAAAGVRTLDGAPSAPPATSVATPTPATARAPLPALGKFKPSPMALDQAGTNVEGLAEGIANRTGPGRAQIVKTVTDRQAAMRPAISGALEESTGLPADAGMQPLQDALAARTAEAKHLYNAARAETKGQPVNSETFDKIIQTPAGKKALQVAQTRQGNMFQEGAAPPPPGYSQEQWDGVKAALAKRGVPVPDGPGAMALPDPETLHFMKEHLAALAKLGTQDGEAGSLSQSAKGALSVWGKVRDELPDVWKTADDAYAARSRVIDMMNKGRQVYSTPSNPTGMHGHDVSPQKAISRSLDALDETAASASVPERNALQTGAAMAARGKLESAPTSIKAPGRIFNRSPETARQTAFAFPSPEHADAFQNLVDSWDKAQQQAERMTGNSRTALRGNETGSSDLLPLSRMVSGRPRGMLRSVVSKLDAEYQAGAKQKLDGEIAKILTSPDGSALVNAAKAGDTRARLLLAMRLGASGTGAEYGTIPSPSSRSQPAGQTP